MYYQTLADAKSSALIRTLTENEDMFIFQEDIGIYFIYSLSEYEQSNTVELIDIIDYCFV